METRESGCPFEAPVRAMLCKACCASSRNAVPPCVKAWLNATGDTEALTSGRGSPRHLATAA